MGPPVVEPTVPEPNRRSVVHPRIVLAGAPLGGRGTVCRIGRRAGVDHAREQDRASVRTPPRTRRARGDVRQALGVATAAQVQDVDLRRIIAFAARAERDPPAVGAPIHATLSAFRIREAAWFGAAVAGHDPEIADLFALRV